MQKLEDLFDGKIYIERGGQLYINTARLAIALRRYADNFDGSNPNADAANVLRQLSDYIAELEPAD